VFSLLAYAFQKRAERFDLISHLKALPFCGYSL
jgi:hypothetical protein